jgi:putative molybdopterin biosynthesis protein
MRPRKDFYLSETPLEKARSVFLSRFLELKTSVEVVDVRDARGRVTAEPVYATSSSPHYNAAAMDGLAVRARDTYAASDAFPLTIEIGAFARYVDTGEHLPAGLDAVIMLEDLREAGEDRVVITKPATPWQHVRVIGEDIVVREMILPEGHQIRPVDIAAMFAGGVFRVAVRRRPRITVIPTGTELVPPDAPRAPGQVVEFNSHMLRETFIEWGADARSLGIVPDDPEAINKAISSAASVSDIVVVNAGSSAGSRDHTARVVSELGEVLIHGVAIKPGKPVILGVVDGVPTVGLPGYPVSALLAAELFVMPLIRAMLGLAPLERDTAEATLIKQVYSETGAVEFVRVRLGNVSGRLVAAPMGRGAGLITSMTRSDGIVVVPAERQGLEAGSQVRVILSRSKQEIDSAIMATGSHDLALDVLGTYLRRFFPGTSLNSAHVGSLGGLAAVVRGETHIAGTHLLDEASHEYNWPYVERLTAGTEVRVCLVNLVGRAQGIMVAPGNPKAIQSIRDLASPGIRFVNRQRGAGTRVLFDQKLRELGISPSSIEGYSREEYTHMAVASAIASGVADAGMGIYAAAQALGLDFVWVADERYDLAVREDLLNTEPIQKVLFVLSSPEFREAVRALGGYDVSTMGTFASRHRCGVSRENPDDRGIQGEEKGWRQCP